MKLAIILSSILVLAMGKVNVPQNSPKAWEGRNVGSLVVSQETIDECIVKYEVSSKSYYTKFLSRPTVPAWRTTVSGVTVGIGVDCGHMSKSHIDETFRGYISNREVELLKSTSGYKGRNAYYNALPKVKHSVRIGWETANDIFVDKTLPTYTARTKSAFRIPEKDTLHPHLNGALLSIVFNRGGSMSSSDRRKEMRQIRSAVVNENYSDIPQYIRNMKRHWSYTKLKGLHLRRDSEAYWAEQGIKKMR